MRFYANFLPQFHECEFNNRWWGKGFTEWNNVSLAEPLFKSHRQPKQPTDGYFDLLDGNEIYNQFAKAKDYGVDGFVIYDYWYNGDKPLGKVINKISNEKNRAIEFSICWANHSWTRSWSNRLGAFDVLIEQVYGKTREEREMHFAYLSNLFVDDRYTRINDKPLFQIYMPENIPDLENWLIELREYCFNKFQFEIHVSAYITGWQLNWDYLNYFDSSTLFQPSLGLFSPQDLFNSSSSSFMNKFNFGSLLRASPLPLRRSLYRIQDLLPDKPVLYDYDQIWKRIIEQSKMSLQETRNVYCSAFIDFDNTPRYGRRAKIFENFSVELFEQYMGQLAFAINNAGKDDIMFINAWNEWGEGMYLQSDIELGDRRLEAVRNVKNNFK